MKKKKTSNNHWLCYVGLVILITLLLAPPLLRWFGKDLFVEEEIKRDELIILNCNKQNETVRSTFLNGIPKNIEYSITGNHSVSVDDTTSDNTQTSTDNKNNFMKIIKPYSKIEYNSDDNITIFRAETSAIRENINYVTLFASVENQQEYFDSQAFYCDKVIY